MPQVNQTIQDNLDHIHHQRQSKNNSRPASGFHNCTSPATMSGALQPQDSSPTRQDSQSRTPKNDRNVQQVPTSVIDFRTSDGVSHVHFQQINYYNTDGHQSSSRSSRNCFDDNEVIKESGTEAPRGRSVSAAQLPASASKTPIVRPAVEESSQDKDTPSSPSVTAPEPPGVQSPGRLTRHGLGSSGRMSPGRATTTPGGGVQPKIEVLSSQGPASAAGSRKQSQSSLHSEEDIHSSTPQPPRLRSKGPPLTALDSTSELLLVPTPAQELGPAVSERNPIWEAGAELEKIVPSSHSNGEDLEPPPVNNDSRGTRSVSPVSRVSDLGAPKTSIIEHLPAQSDRHIDTSVARTPQQPKSPSEAPVPGAFSTCSSRNTSISQASDSNVSANDLVRDFSPANAAQQRRLQSQAVESAREKGERPYEPKDIMISGGLNGSKASSAKQSVFESVTRREASERFISKVAEDFERWVCPLPSLRSAVPPTSGDLPSGDPNTAIDINSPPATPPSAHPPCPQLRVSSRASITGSSSNGVPVGPPEINSSPDDAAAPSEVPAEAAVEGRKFSRSEHENEVEPPGSSGEASDQVHPQKDGEPSPTQAGPSDTSPPILQPVKLQPDTSPKRGSSSHHSESAKSIDGDADSIPPPAARRTRSHSDSRRSADVPHQDREHANRRRRCHCHECNQSRHHNCNGPFIINYMPKFEGHSTMDNSAGSGSKHRHDSRESSRSSASSGSRRPDSSSSRESMSNSTRGRKSRRDEQTSASSYKSSSRYRQVRTDVLTRQGLRDKVLEMLGFEAL